jgi:hypothetical protein
MKPEVLRLLLRIMLPLAALLLLPVLLIRAQPYDDREVQSLLTPPQGCPAPCFMGIRPGVTTINEATDTLRTHAWVEDFTALGTQRDSRGRFIYSEIRWNWSDAAPVEINHIEPGRMYFMQPDPLYDLLVVQTIQVETRLRTWLVEQWFGQPASSSMSYHNRRLGYSVMFVPDEQPTLVVISTALMCPATLMHYWDSRARLTLTVPYSIGPYIPFKDALRYCSFGTP